MCVVIIFAMVWRSFGVKGFWALWHKIITESMVILLEQVLNIYTLICRNNALKQKTFHSSMVCCVHAILYNTEKQTVQVLKF
jgi:hypothetical protein